jgi:hypothetical protein
MTDLGTLGALAYIDALRARVAELEAALETLDRMAGTYEEHHTAFTHIRRIAHGAALAAVRQEQP